jgi:hypothetical protein
MGVPAIIAVLIMAVSLTHAAAGERLLTTNPSESVLLLDDHTVARAANLTQRFFPADKHPANPVMRRTEPWEGIGPYIWGNRLMQDEKTNLFRLWYITYDYAGNFYRWGYATSPDGIGWTKPDLGVERYADAPATNLLPLGPHPEKGTRSIARDPRPETPIERRYLGVRFTYEGEYVSFSPDGIAWKEHPQSPSWFVPSDIIHVMWDEPRKRFIAYYKLWELAGTEVTAAGEEKPFLAYMPTFTPTKLPDNKESFEGPVIHFKLSASAEVTNEKFVLRAANQGKDDGGGTSLSGAWRAKRVQAFADSEDGIHWSNEQVVLRADENDPPTANIQYMFVIPYGGYYVGFLTLHDEAGHFRIQLAHSADGLKWHRPSRDPWLDVGPEGSFDCGMVLGPGDPIIGEKEMWFPYGGFPIRHDSKETNWESAIGLAVTRLDGFAAWEAADETGELVTQPFRCNGDRLFVNADARDGEISVEVLDERGTPIEGFDAASSKTVSVDTLAQQDDGWIQWKTEENLSSLQGRQIQLRFMIRRARLFSFRVADAKTMKLPVPRATNR